MGCPISARVAATGRILGRLVETYSGSARKPRRNASINESDNGRPPAIVETSGMRGADSRRAAGGAGEYSPALRKGHNLTCGAAPVQGVTTSGRAFLRIVKSVAPMTKAAPIQVGRAGISAKKTKPVKLASSSRVKSIGASAEASPT